MISITVLDTMGQKCQDMMNYGTIDSRRLWLDHQTESCKNELSMIPMTAKQKRSVGPITGKYDDGSVPPAVTIPGTMPVNKRSAMTMLMREMAKKQALEAKNDAVEPVVVQVDDKFREKLVLVVALPGNISESSQISVEFADGSNGSILIIWVPRGKAISDMDKVRAVLNSMGDKGITPEDAIFFSHALENRMMSKRRHIHDTVIDPFTISLDKACDISKHPIVALYQSKEDGDTACCIVLDVPMNRPSYVESLCNSAKFVV